MTAPTDVCNCGHARDHHDHYRRGSDCGSCGPEVCPAFVAYGERPVWRPRLSLVVWVVVAAIVVYGGAAFVVEQVAFGASTRCESTACLHRALAWQKKHNADLTRQLAVHWEPTRARLICPIATALGVSCAEARAVNRCESNTDRMVANSSAHVGWFQESSSFMSDNGLPWANARRWEPVVNVLAALLVVRREGWGQWTCRP